MSEEVHQEVSPREPGENNSAYVPKFKYQEITICRKPPPSRDDTSDEVPNCITAGADSASLSATSPVVSPAAATGVSSARFLGAGAFLTQVHGGSSFCLPSFFMLTERGLQRARRLHCGRDRCPHRRRPRCAWRQWNSCRHGTTTTDAPHSSPKVAWDTVGHSWRLRLRERRLTW